MGGLGELLAKFWGRNANTDLSMRAAFGALLAILSFILSKAKKSKCVSYRLQNTVAGRAVSRAHVFAAIL